MLLGDIGEGSSALFCLTDRESCCSITKGGERRGAWRFPDGNEVELAGSGNFYRERCFSSILLNRRNGALEPTGIYTCQIPDEADSSTTSRTLYIGVYASTPGPLTASLTYDRASHTLTCVSSGGPVNTVTWRRNSEDISSSSSSYQRGQSLNAITSTYHNFLTVTSSSVEDYIGSFSCTVSSNGSEFNSSLVSINGRCVVVLTIQLQSFYFFLRY